MSTKSSAIKPGSAPVERNWVWLLGLGIIFVILGTIGLGMTFALTLASMLFFGFLLIIAGTSQLIDSFTYKQWQGAIWHAIIAIFYIIGGIIVIYDPLFASTIITVLLAWVLIVIGITRFIMALTLKNQQGWVWLLFAGLMAMILGVLILAHWPLSGLWVIGLFIAIEMLVTGWSSIFLALAIRRT